MKNRSLIITLALLMMVSAVIGCSRTNNPTAPATGPTQSTINADQKAPSAAPLTVSYTYRLVLPCDAHVTPSGPIVIWEGKRLTNDGQHNAWRDFDPNQEEVFISTSTRAGWKISFPGGYFEDNWGNWFYCEGDTFTMLYGDPERSTTFGGAYWWDYNGERILLVVRSTGVKQ